MNASACRPTPPQPPRRQARECPGFETHTHTHRLILLPWEQNRRTCPKSLAFYANVVTASCLHHRIFAQKRTSQVSLVRDLRLLRRHLCALGERSLEASSSSRVAKPLSRPTPSGGNHGFDRGHLRWDVVAASASSSTSATTVSAMDPTGSYSVRAGHHCSL